MKSLLAITAVLAAILSLSVCDKSTPSSTTKTEQPPALTAAQIDRLRVFSRWVAETDVDFRVRHDSDFAHDVKIESLAITHDNYVCGVVWFRYPISKKNFLRYVLPPGDRIRPWGGDDKINSKKTNWDDFGCDSARAVELKSE